MLISQIFRGAPYSVPVAYIQSMLSAESRMKRIPTEASWYTLAIVCHNHHEGSFEHGVVGEGPVLCEV